MKTAKEGLVALHIPESRKEAFYNPEMELSRDMSVAFLQAVRIKNAVVCDLLSATGVRAVRYAKETDAKKVFANDASEKAVKYIKKNAAINNVADKISVSCKGANAFLASHKKDFDFIDIDPFGSPVYFLDEISKNVKPDSYLAVTATDCGALAGIFPKTCEERYGVKLERTECFKEIGIRNLIGVVAMNLQKHKYFVSPLLSHATEHYFRIFLKVGGKGEIPIKKFCHCKNCGYCTFERILECEFCKTKISSLGPLWSGDLYDKSLCFSILDTLRQNHFQKSANARKIMLSVIAECKEPFYYNIHRISERVSKNTPAVDDVITELKKLGFRATHTQFSNTSVKTDAKTGIIRKIIQLLDKQRQQKPSK